MWRDMLKVMAATAAFAGVHSFFASQYAKRKAAELYGERQRNGLYRLFYNGQAVVTAAALAAYIRRVPGGELYHVRGPAGLLMVGGQAVALVLMTDAARRVGILRMAGWESFVAWRRGDPIVPPEPEAQGPALRPDGTMDAAGPFMHTRHPLNFYAMALFWLSPRMTTNLLAFNLAATAYFVVGSRHEEANLLAAYDEVYEEYRRSGVPFFVPGAAKPPSELHDARHDGGDAGQVKDESYVISGG